MITVLRSAWIWAATGLLILFWLPLLALIHLFDRDPARYRTGRWFRRLGVAMVKVNPAWRLRITGTRIDDPRRPYVVVSNHQSLADIPFISHLPWEMKWVAKIELFRIPFIGKMMSLAGDIALDRGERTSGARALIRANNYLQEKVSVMFFPEGTRSLDGRVYPFTDGAFQLAIRAQVPVLPVVVDGSFDCLPRHSWKFGRPREVFLHVLPPVETTGLTTKQAGELRERVRQLIIAQMAAWRGVPPEQLDAAGTKESVNTV